MKQTIFGVVILLTIAGAVIVFQKEYFTSNVPGATPSPRPNLIVYSPKPNATVTNPVRVKGEGMAFESTFSYRLRDTNGKILYENNAMLKGFEYPKYGTFDFKIAIPPNPTTQLTVEVFEYSAKDGAVTNLVRVPVQLANQDTTTVQTYFLNDKMDPQQTCTQVFPVERVVPKTKEVAFVAVSELLRGITPVEKNAKYVTALPERVAINSLVISDSVARIDFNYALDGGIGGSCRVSAIRAQITQTLKQFSNVKEVIISREGNTDDVLQP